MFSMPSAMYVSSSHPHALPDLHSVCALTIFWQFVRVHQQLLNILIGKAGLFTAVPVIGQPVATVLRSLEGVVDVSRLLFPISLDTPNSIDEPNVRNRRRLRMISFRPFSPEPPTSRRRLSRWTGA